MSRRRLKCLAAGKTGGQTHELNASVNLLVLREQYKCIFLIKTLARTGYLATFLD